ncbi:hypothetical protein GUITHDRAFT_137888 [Guillardia theta CCMP2712]|uniref:Uncharacterized protein n=1 Tax=Guillardia theta (strain CCMP2712) TaxID=905079 RepID=L1JEF2_GUITC|nr:hypothetical protein GUITHDRAFT_137888 [Guillardia theta CCMP2712]EKX46903.1 hypothetical protein GUITHDRAFT_137888 [Guillardia theta CCMP2712]|eukprot:XP_005833883.1 hypothetical protein GUITHDRAFT_137888 [Guillardia theta CCMP2712]
MQGWRDRLKPRRVAQEPMGDPISCFCMAQDLLVFTGTINGRVCAWRMKEATEDSKSTELANLPGEPVTSMDTSATHLFCTFGDRFSKGWRIADVVTGDNLYQHGGESSFLTRSSRDGETFDFKRCQSESSKFCLIFTRGQGWSQLFDLERSVISDVDPRNVSAGMEKAQILMIRGQKNLQETPHWL